MKLHYVEEEHQAESMSDRRIVTQHIACKWYNLLNVYEVLPSTEELRTAHEIASYKAKHQLPSHAGLGFIIFSGNMLNICLWDKQEPTLIHPYLYNLKKEHDRRERTSPVRLIRRENLNKVSPFCFWEMRLVARESIFWESFLQSKQQKADKTHYLAQGFTGRL